MSSSVSTAQMSLHDYFKKDHEKYANLLVKDLLQEQCAAVAHFLGNVDDVTKYKALDACIARQHLVRLIVSVSGNGESVKTLVDAFVFANLAAKIVVLNRVLDLKERCNLEPIAEAAKQRKSKEGSDYMIKN